MKQLKKDVIKILISNKTSNEKINNIEKLFIISRVKFSMKPYDEKKEIINNGIYIVE